MFTQCAQQEALSWSSSSNKLAKFCMLISTVICQKCLQTHLKYVHSFPQICRGILTFWNNIKITWVQIQTNSALTYKGSRVRLIQATPLTS